MERDDVFNSTSLKDMDGHEINRLVSDCIYILYSCKLTTLIWYSCRIADVGPNITQNSAFCQ